MYMAVRVLVEVTGHGSASDIVHRLGALLHHLQLLSSTAVRAIPKAGLHSHSTPRQLLQ
jgi:hypothetical protein